MLARRRRDAREVVDVAHDRNRAFDALHALVEQLGGRVVVVAGESTNRKITTPDDLTWARSAILEPEGPRPSAGAGK